MITGCKKAESPAAAEAAKLESESGTITFVDGMDKTVTIKKNPQRVVCLYTSFLDLWDLAGGKVVGRVDSKENVPEAARTVDTVGSYTSPNIEKIISLQPDLVLLSPSVSSQVALIPVLEKNNIQYVALDYMDFDDYLNMLKVYTDLTGKEELYQANGMDVKKKVDSIIARVPKDKKPSILLMLGSAKSVSVRLPDSTVGDMLQDLGAINIAYDENLKAKEMEVFSMERVIEKDPDFILVQTMGDIAETTARIKKDVEDNPAWGYLTAVKEGRYIYLPKDLFLFKPNERYAEAYQELAKLLYPEIFN